MRRVNLWFARLCRWIKRTTGIEKASHQRSQALQASTAATRRLSEAADGAQAAVAALLLELEGGKRK